MSKDKRVINVGLLPEQTEDYSQYEESELNWGRILTAAALALLVVVILIALLLPSDDETTNTLDAINNDSATNNTAKLESPTVAVNNTVSPTANPKPDIATEPEKTSSLEKSIKEINSPLPKQASVPISASKKTITQETHLSTHPIKLIAPVKIFDSHIASAQLSSSLVKGRPADALSSRVIMSNEGIIRVHLYTEMTNLRGQDLYHHWYRNGEKQARVRIPVNHNQQHSSSSKFINKQMLGKWTVQVLDEEGKAYIEANFEVVSP